MKDGYKEHNLSNMEWKVETGCLSYFFAMVTTEKWHFHKFIVFGSYTKKIAKCCILEALWSGRLKWCLSYLGCHRNHTEFFRS